jgi:hypothetical protein
MPRNCEEFKNLIVSLVYDESSGMETRVVQRHLSECQGCAKFKAEIEQTGELLENWIDVDIPVDLTTLHSRTERKLPSAFRLPWQKRWFAWTATAFGIAAVLFLAFGLIGTEIKWEQNTLTVRFGGKSDTQNELTPEILLQAQYQALSSELSEELQAAIAQLSQAILEHQESQKIQWALLIEAIQAQRNYDMELIKEELQNLANSTEDELQKAYLTLDLLIAAEKKE